MDWLTLFSIIGIILGNIPALIAYFKARRKRKATEAALTQAQDEKARAEAEEAKAKADAELREVAEQLIAQAEITFEGLDKMLKAQNSSAATVKKDMTFTKLQALALQKGYDFDTETWSKIIDNMVAFTKKVNAKNTPKIQI